MNFWSQINRARILLKKKQEKELKELLFEINMFIGQTKLSDKKEVYLDFFEKFIQTYKLSNLIDSNENNMIDMITEESSITIENIGGSIDNYVKKIGKGVSLVTCCMNRNENLVKALSSWITCRDIKEIIIVDWSSTDSVFDYINSNGIKDKRIKVIRVNDQPRWILSYAFNIGFRMASYDTILKSDADIIIYPDFFKKNKLTDETFISGDWRIAPKGQEHINGFFYIYREKLMKIK